MKHDFTEMTTGYSGLGVLRWAFSATLALIFVGLSGGAMAWLAVYLLSQSDGLKIFMPVIAELVFTLGITGLPLLVGYLYFTGRFSTLTSWSQKLHPFFHLSSDLPEFPQALGLGLQRLTMPVKHILAWAAGGLALTYVFDFALSRYLSEAVGADAAFSHAGTTGGAAAALASMGGGNFLLAALVMAVVAAIAEEFLYRGILVNLWSRVFSVQAQSLSQYENAVARAFSRFLEVGGAYLAVIVAAALFSLAHGEDFLSMFFFGVVAGVVYLQTGTIWSAVVMHGLGNSIVAVVLLFHIISAGLPSGNSASLVPATQIPTSNAAATGADAGKVTADASASASAADVHSVIGVRFPGLGGVIGPVAGKTDRPLVTFVTQTQLDSDSFNASGNLFMQVCKHEECAAQLPQMEALAREYPDVEFVQADASKTPGLIKRMEQEQAALAKYKNASGAGQKVSAEVSYPVYFYINQDAQQAPPDARDEAQLKQFIQMNFTDYEAPTNAEVGVSPYVSKLCNPDNDGKFDGKKQYACAYDVVYNSDLALLDTAKRQAFKATWEHKYDDSDALSSEEGTEKAIASMFSDLHEMHSRFLNRKQYVAEFKRMDSNLSGVGLPLFRLNMVSTYKALGEKPSKEDLLATQKLTETTPLVVFPRPEPGSPAEAAGLKRGDRILEVDGKPALGRTSEEVVNLIRGPAGTTVVIKVRRQTAEGFEEPTFTITRGNVHNSEAALTSLPGGYATVKTSVFGNSISRDFSESLYTACTGKTLPAGGSALSSVVNGYVPENDCTAKGIVIDLQGNPGGRLDQVIEMLQAVMKEGRIISTRTRSGDKVIEVRYSVTATEFRRETFEDGRSIKVVSHPRMWRVLPDLVPIVVLVDGDSASASEIMAGSLQQNGRALVAGKPSFGKEVGQVVVPIDFGAGMNVTTFRFLPGGVDMGPAILPELLVERSDLFFDNPLLAPDPVLAKALDLLGRGKVAFSEARSRATVDKKALAEQVVAEHKVRDEKIFAEQKEGLD